ncbi:MAG: RNA-directed DNA polymerase [Anaerolineae bacterium]|nr:RNA-directed DNA polymerase [Anaerolineae bacterium]
MWHRLPYALRKLRQTLIPIRYEPPDYALWNLQARLGLTPAEVSRLAMPGPFPPRFRYRHFTVPKKDGGRREICAPGPRLKEVQRQILRAYLDPRAPHPAAMGFRRALSIADHAWAHAGAAIIITADIEDFFPSTRARRVAAWWAAQGFNDAEVHLLTRLTTYRGSLPQGAPTSPALSNLVNAELDAALHRRAQQSGGVYTRYCDDLAFSWPDGGRPPADFEPAVRAALLGAGYRLHSGAEKGWQMWARRDEPEVTGLVLTRRGGVALPPPLYARMRSLARSDDPHDAARLAGYKGYELMIRKRR